ncbi:MAG: hypothetical protein AAFN77_18095 [Planctomycetota bacterium]
MANEYLIWFSAFIFYITYRSFRNSSPNHKVGVVISVMSAVLVYGIGSYCSTHSSPSVFWNAVCTGAISYSVSVSIYHVIPASPFSLIRSLIGVNSEPPQASKAQLLEGVQQELDAQLLSIDQSPFDSETVEDLKEAARQNAVEKMARILESE